MNRTCRVAIVVLCGVVLSLTACPRACAEEEAAEEAVRSGFSESIEVNATGTVSVVKNDRGKTEITFTTSAGTTYTVKPQGNGRMLSMANGRSVEVRGKARDKKGESVLDISTCRILP